MSDANPAHPAPVTLRPRAVALAYEPGDHAPRVVAKGYGSIAEDIIRQARATGIFVHDAPELVNLLMRVDLDASIPPTLYAAIAELLAWLYRIEHGLANQLEPASSS